MLFVLEIGKSTGAIVKAFEAVDEQLTLVDLPEAMPSTLAMLALNAVP